MQIMRKYFFIVFIVGIIFISCTHTGIIKNDHKYSENPECGTFHLKDSLELNLDSETTPILGYIQYIDADSTQSIAILNDYNHSIYVYDYNNKSLLNKIKINTTKPQGFFMDDHLYVYSYQNGTLSIIDGEKNIRRKTIPVALQDDRRLKIFNPYPYATTLSPIIKYKNYIVAIGYKSGEPIYETTTNRPVISVLDLITQEVSASINYPEIYSQYHWGGQMPYRLPYYTLTPTGIIVVSFPASHDLIISSLDNLSKVTTAFGGSRYIKEIRSYPSSKRKVGLSSSDVWNWYIGNPSYEGILYDKYRNLYYRIARLPDNNYKSGEIGNHKPIVIIVLDHSLKYLGEYLLPEGPWYFPTNMFVSKDGLNIQVLTDNEDILKFYTYEYMENGN